ncbi:glycosyltransferase family 39 protein [Falsiroseomonas oryzae]|uniref:glycosyltransferase family 39 protein n=1 Tax=Falsiroseomonas oryzae TaxID=2766473 RepID=UPI0022EB0FBF|nr:glycosyltransferase family 39 protein [Roseomonas sp. MO-31]
MTADTFRRAAPATHSTGSLPKPEWSRREALVLAAILLLAAAMRVGAAVAVPSPLESDYLGYWNLAGHLAAGRGLILEDGKPTAFLSIGYPIFLAGFFVLFGTSIAVVKAVNVVLGIAAVLFAYLAARAMFRSPWAAALGALILAAYVEASVYGAYVAKENLMVFLLMAQLVLAAHAGAGGAWRVLNPVLFGVATGWLVVTGNAAISFLPGFVAIAFFARGAAVAPTLRYFVLAGLVGALTIAPVVVRNHLAFGGWGVNNNGGFNLYLGNNPNATPYFMSIADTPMGPRWHALREELGERGSSQYLGELAKQHILDNPGETIALSLRKALAFWEPPTHSGKYEETRVEQFVRLIWLVQYLGIALLCVAAFLRLRQDWRGIGAILLMVAGYTAVHMLFYVVYRYRLPIMPMLCVLAGLGAHALLMRLARSPAERRRATA